jgi:hypothetical protein
VLCAPSGEADSPVRFDRRLTLRDGRLVEA